MRTKKLIKRFDFVEDQRKTLTLGTGVRLNPEGRLELSGPDFSQPYPTTPDLFAKTRLTNPKTAKSWVGFQALYKNKKNTSNVDVTAVRFRLSPDGLQELWWNGTAWASASPGEWNTEQEVADHIAAFAFIAIQVVINLSTTDATQTPEVYAVKLLWESTLEFQEDYIARSLIPALRAEIRPMAEMATRDATSTVDMGSIETPYNISGIDAVFDITTDPDRLTDLFVSYDSTTKVATFTPVPLGNTVIIQFTYEPEVAMATSQDYTELAKTPAIIIESITNDSKRFITHGEHVINKGAGTGYQLKDGYHADLDLVIMWTADKLKDLDRISDEVKRFFKDRLLRSVGQDEFFRMYTTGLYSHQPAAPQSELHAARLRARICEAVFYPQGATPVHVTQRLVVTGSLDFTV